MGWLSRLSLRRSVRVAWHLLVVALVAVACWRYIDFGTILTSWKRIDASWFLLLIAIGIVDRFLMAGKWLQLLRSTGMVLSLGTVVSAYFQAGLMQRLFPSSLGGDALRAVVVARKTGNGATVLGSMVVEKVVAMGSSVMLATAGLALVLVDIPDGQRMLLGLLVLAFFLLMILAVYLSFKQRFVETVLGWLPTRVRKPLEQVYTTYISYRHRRAVLGWNLFLCLIEQSVQIGVVVLSAFALGTDANPTTILAALAIAQCLRKFAILAEGWALGEFTTVFICGLFGIDESQALAFSLLAHATDIVASLPGALLFARFAGGVGSLRESAVALEAREIGVAESVDTPAAASQKAVDR